MHQNQVNRRGNPVFRAPAALIAIALFALACGPTGAPTAGERGDQSSRGAAPKTLHFGYQTPGASIAPAMWGGYPTSGSGVEVFLTFHGNLTMYDLQGNVVGHIAQKVPKVDDGDWKLLPNGGMEVTWRIRPDVFYHDGTRLSAEDFVFGFQVIRDPALPIGPWGERNKISEVQAPDPQTVVVTWNTLSILGDSNAAAGVPAVPRHIFQDLYLTGDKVAFENSPAWYAAQWIGLGPYRITEFAEGVQLVAVAFDRYFLGRPKIDRLVIHYFGSPETLVANVLAGVVDVVGLGTILDVSQMVAIRQVWEPINGGLTLPVLKGVRPVYLQMRDASKPWAQDVRIRQAMMHAMDREAIGDTFLNNLTGPADFFVFPEDPVYRLIEQARLPRNPYDPAQAERLFNAAGWTRSANQPLRNSAGDTMNIDIVSSSSGSNVAENESVASFWNQAGVVARSTPYGRAVTTSEANELRHTTPGATIWPWNFSLFAHGNLSAAEIGTAANRYLGANYGGYVNPTYDALWGQFTTTLDSSRRNQQVFQMMKIIAEEVPVIPMFFATNAVIARKGVEGPGSAHPVQPAITGNIHTWDLKS